MAKELDRFDTTAKKAVSLRTKLIAMIVGASIIGVTVSGAVSLATFDSGLNTQTLEELEHTTEGCQWILEDWLDTLSGYGDMLASTDHIKGYLDANDTTYTDNPNIYLREKGIICRVDLLAITDMSGTVVAGYNANAGYKTSLSLVKSALAGNRSYAYGSFGNISFGLLVASPVIKQGKKLGALVIGYELASQEEDGYVSIVNKNHFVECTIFDGKVRASTTLGVNMIGTELFLW